VEILTSSLTDLSGPHTEDPISFAEQLSHIRRQLSLTFDELKAEKQKPVRQQSMAAGEIELF
jgi:hypothetical protein